MATISFYARGASTSANNASLNAQNTNTTPTTLLTFTSGTNGDLTLETNNGGPDPDTQVIIGSTTYNFTLIFSGTLPSTNKLSNVAGADLRGKQIAVIEANGQRYFILTDGTGSFTIMDAFPNGAHDITAVNTTSPVVVCFLNGTLIETETGPRPIDDLQVGEKICTADGRLVPLRWIGARIISPAEMMFYPHLQPVTIPKGLFGPDLPFKTLRLSAPHRVAMGGGHVQLYFGFDNALMPVHHLTHYGAFRSLPQRNVTYYHLMFDEHEIIVANGVPCESYQLGQIGVLALTPDQYEAAISACPGQTEASLLARKDCMPSLSGYEAKVLLNAMAFKSDVVEADPPDSEARASKQKAQAA
jgi:hypothetical protein